MAPRESMVGFEAKVLLDGVCIACVPKFLGRLLLVYSELADERWQRYIAESGSSLASDDW